MYQFLLVDDSPEQLHTLSGIIANYPANINICTAHDYFSALSLIETTKFDVFILNLKPDDCLTNSMNGILFGIALRDMVSYLYTPIIFIAETSESIQKALINVCYSQCILNPYTTEDMANCLNYIFHSPLVPPPVFSFLDFWNGPVEVPEKSILYVCSGANRRLSVHTDNEIYETNTCTLSHLTQEMRYGFLRCHRKYLVNLSRITDYHRANQIISIGSEDIPLGRKYKSEFDKLWKTL